MTPKETFGLCCLHIGQLMTLRLFTHYRLPCSHVTSLWHPAEGKSESGSMSSHDGLQNFKTSTSWHQEEPLGYVVFTLTN